jgi:cytochrome bd ubiquinol oxidase subunit II
VMVVVSAVFGVLTMILVWTERYGLARFASAVAVVAIVVGWALAQRPYLLPPSLTLERAAAADVTLQATIIVVAIAVVVLGPSLWFLYRLVLRGQLDQNYEPLDQRFNPVER